MGHEVHSLQPGRGRLAVSLGAILLAATPTWAQSPPRYYTIADLGPGDAFRVMNYQLGYTAGALDLGLCAGAAGPRFGFFFDGFSGKRRSFCPLPGDAASEVFDFETLGQKSALGYSRSASGNDRPVIWNENLNTGEFAPQAMGLPAGSPGGVAWGTDWLGRVVGEVTVSGERRAAYWLIPTWAPTTFPLAGTSAAFQIGGSIFNPVAAVQHQGRFGLWYTGSGQVTYPLGETPSVAYRMNTSSTPMTAIGQRGAPGSGQAFLWRSDTGATALPNLLLGSNGAARDYRDPGFIVGSSHDAGGRSRAVLWEGPFTWDLNTLKLPTCRDDNEVACAPWDLEVAHGVGTGGQIVGSGTLNGQRHAFLAKPVDLLTWSSGVCAVSSQPFCVPPVTRTGRELIIDPYQVKEQVPESSSAAGPYAAAAQSYAEHHGIWIPNSSSSFRGYVVFEPKSVIDALLPGQTGLDVRFHFKVDGMAAGGSGQSLGSVNAGVALRPARNAGAFSGANGSRSAQGGALTSTGIFAGQGVGSTGDVELPLQIQPLTGNGLEVRIEGSASASTLAAGLTWSSGDVSVRFCSEDPRSITLPDGTPLADIGVKYTLWPTVRRDPDEDDPCRNPLTELTNDTPVCDPGGSDGGGTFRVVAPPVVLPGERVELQAVGRPPGGTLTATVVSGNATVEGYRPCTTYPDGSARCPVIVRASPLLGPDMVVAVRLTYEYNGGGANCRFQSTVQLLSSRLHFVDPIDADAPGLINSATPLAAQPVEFIRRDAARLARRGRRVKGLAADGVTPVVLRFRAPGPGTVTFTVADDRGSRDALRVGRLADPFAGPPVAYGNPVTVTTRQVGFDHWAFAVLTAPRDFIRPTVPGDESLGHARPRRLPVQVDFTPEAGGGAPFRVTRNLDLVRPPVMLIHGVWSSSGSWKWGLTRDDRFFDYPHNYDTESGKTFFENYKQGWWGVQNTLKAFRQQALAATQVDVFAHSMGGILSRIYIGGPDYGDALGVPAGLVRARAPAYEERLNFGAGTIHKLVIIDSPQLGSPLANWMVAHPTVRALMRLYEPRSIGGAVEDLQRAGNAVRAFPTVALPVHAMMGQGGGAFVVAGAVTNTPRWLWPFVNTTVLYTGLGAAEFLQSQFDPEPDHDVIVGICSMRAGLPQGPVANFVTSDFIQSMHTNNTSSAAYNEKAITLLNAPVGSSAFAPGLLPHGPPGQLCTPQGLRAESWTVQRRVAPGTGALAAPPLPLVLEGGLVITSPPPGTVVTAGTDVPVTVEAAEGYVPTRIMVVAGAGAQVAVGSRFDGSVHVPVTEYGDVPLLALGLDAQDQIAAAVPVTIRVQAPAGLTGLVPLVESVVLDAATPTAPLHLSGSFGDGVDRDITSASTSTTYDSQDPAVATVDAEGRVTAVRAGTTLVRGANGGLEAIVEVRVLSTPSDADGDGDVDVADFVELRACWSGPGEDEGFQAPSNPCRDMFDADRDGDVDQGDYPDFLARYTGPPLDCNGNGELDLTDIVQGTSQDLNGDGVPDECGGS